MEPILIHVPPFLHPCVTWIRMILATLRAGWQYGAQAVSVASSSLEHVLHLPRNAFLPITAIILVFWPILLSLVMALASASAWIFWLVTSIVFGLLQLGYAIYQFVMIACNIFGLSILKTYSMLRSQVLYYLGAGPSSRLRGKSQRRLWRQRLEDAGNYENFLKIRIRDKDESEVLQQSSSFKHKGQRSDPALPPLPPPPSPSPPRLPRAKSFSSMEEQHDDSSLPTSKKTSMTRTRSFSGTTAEEQQCMMSSYLEASVDPVVSEELGEKTANLLVTTTSRLKEARVMAVKSSKKNKGQGGGGSQEAEAAANKSSLKYLLSAVMKRNHLTLDDILIENGRSIAESGQYGLTTKSRQLIRAYYSEVEAGLETLVELSLPSEPVAATAAAAAAATEAEQNISNEELLAMDRRNELSDRITLVRKMKQNMGRTALMLSGGGAQAMYHLGTIRALIESKLYDDIKVISGTSGGSIAAAMCAMKTSDELCSHVCVPNVSTDYMKTGEMKKKNIRWFPTIMEMGAHWLKHKLLVDSAMFRETCEFYYSDVTFEEAFERTGKHVCITVSASRASGGTAQRLLLNHISTPHVTLASAVAASCALPGVMAPAKLIAKNSNGNLEPFEVDGTEWIDGSVQADLPFQRISTLFAISSFIVSQTNFHIVPLLNKAHHPSRKSLYWRLFQTMEWDIRSRALKLSRLGLFPRIFGQDISKIFKQRYHGNLTIVPRFTTMQTFGLKALSNPTEKDMEGYLKYGQIAAWPYLNIIRDMIRLEKALDDCLRQLEERMRSLSPDVDWLNHDDVESITSSSVVASTSSRVRIIGRPPIGISLRDRDSDRMRKKISNLEQENQSLRQQLEQLKKLLSHSGEKKKLQENGQAEQPEHPEKLEPLVSSLSDGSEGEIWSFVLRRKSAM